MTLEKKQELAKQIINLVTAVLGFAAVMVAVWMQMSQSSSVVTPVATQYTYASLSGRGGATTMQKTLNLLASTVDKANPASSTETETGTRTLQDGPFDKDVWNMFNILIGGQSNPVLFKRYASSWIRHAFDELVELGATTIPSHHCHVLRLLVKHPVSEETVIIHQFIASLLAAGCDNITKEEQVIT